MGKEASPTELYTVIRAQIEHVDNNIGQRVIWLVIAQSFFFNGYALLINGKPELPELFPLYSVFIKVLPIAAVLTVLFTSIDLVASLVYIKNLRHKYKNSLGSDDGGADDFFPAISGSRRQRTFMHTSPVLIPVIFIVVWLILMYYQYTHALPVPAQ